MGLESDGAGDAAELPGSGHGRREQPLVAAMDTVEDADGAGGRSGGRTAVGGEGVLQGHGHG